MKNYGLSVVPLFVFMGVFAARAGLSRALYECIHTFVGHLRGGLAMATIGACAGFGAICGSSLATCATIGRIALPKMLRRSYPPELAMASVAAAGTLGILIPPSILMIIYGIVTSTSIGALFAAAIVPGAIATALYAGAVAYAVRGQAGAEPVETAASPDGRWPAIREVWQVALLFVVTIGGIYVGLFSPTEAAAIGAGASVLIAAMNRKLGRGVLWDGLVETATMTGMIFTVLIGASLFNVALQATEFPAAITAVIGDSGLSFTAVLISIIAFYIVLGCFMNSLSMIVLTLPVTAPIASRFDMDPVWFGILVTTVVEIGLITPPIGMNLFVVQRLVPDVRQGAVMRGIAPFIAADLVRVTILAAFPALTLTLPHALGF